ncbi:MAG: hypothetical protein IJQ36_05885 [Oscillospiraceae bacterium]|nr:hypothetical protein [Oscillospiraceae bacterium]MBQ7143765.1 hypothetical protein [Oscillospiraceae bacterium]
MAGTYEGRRFGDRKEGRLLRSLPPFNRFIPYIMKNRNDATNLYSDALEISEIEHWLRDLRKSDWKGMGMLHLFLAAYVRTVSQCPAVNRFINGQKIYARNNIEVVMIVKKTMAVDAEETAIKVIFEPTDTIFDVYRKMNEKIEEIKAGDENNNTEDVAETLMKLPGFLLRFAVAVLKSLDYVGLLPQALLDASPFHGSLIITDLGSLGTLPVYHHIYNFGNLPFFLAFGSKRRAWEIDRTGQPVERKYVDYRVSMDERICDGAYLVNSMKYMKYFLSHPQELEEPPKQVKFDVF